VKKDAEEQFLEYCSHIVQWGDRIPGFIKDMTYEQFARDEITHLAVWKCVEILGEAARTSKSAIRNCHSNRRMPCAIS
jgi:uncharacterized protein with HEPN domain